ncbi:hypothetical protein K3148_09810 [Qipengyuania aurantiaca]|uniref:DUF2336 domain-containing protein n=1 Tax=Qipengyuania aurantiaca TaxID=2867233 RepID=A0ABX8ZK60_9SPHN|nr:hypothetical protein [Qipengyuania aurantiaca]QZD89131.1 hypothetical protein K3148_09810 [Qipengyuania aurantiaca]
MRIDPQIRALRGDPASQRLAQEELVAACDSWRSGAGAEALADLQRYGEGQPLDECPALKTLLNDQAAAFAWLAPLLDAGLESLTRNPLGQFPMRHQYSDGVAMIQLGLSGRAALTLIAYDELQQSPKSASFSAGERHELVLSGVGDFRFVDLLEERANSAAIDQRVRRLVAGETLSCDGATQTRVLERVHGRMVMLRLARTDAAQSDTRQYSLEDGRLLHRASGNRLESQREMATALLGRMGRSDAAPLLAELTREGSAHIRWQSLRECLGLDTATGFAALTQIAADASDELSSPASALRAQLLEAYPQLASLEAIPCPA